MATVQPLELASTNAGLAERAKLLVLAPLVAVAAACTVFHLASRRPL